MITRVDFTNLHGCALNTFVQDNVYKLKSSKMSAYCIRKLPKGATIDDLPDTFGINRCFVSFGSPDTGSKDPSSNPDSNSGEVSTCK